MPVNPTEELKRKKDGLDVLQDIYRYAREGFNSIESEDFDRFKWYGLYQQKPKEGHFMLRVKIPGGHLSSEQLVVLAGIARDFGRGFGDITTRQAYQFHWLTIEDVPEIFHRLEDAGLTTIGACGDIMRNVTGCPVAGRDRREIFDAQPDVDLVTHHFLGRKEYSNLPRKYKVSISACGINCSFPQINCASFVGVPHGPQTPEAEGYNIYIGGGLSTSPHFAQPVNAFITRDQVVEAVTAITEIYRDHGGRDRRTRARLKFLMDDWGPQRFREEIAARVSFDLAPASGHLLRDEHQDHLGVFPQKQDGLNYIGVTVPTGRITAEQMLATAELARSHGSGRLANTIQQNFIVLDVPDTSVVSATRGLKDLGFETGELSVKADSVVCTGNEFCNLAVTETKRTMGEIMAYLEKHALWDRHIKINMNGCPNSCGQHWIADIGLQGASTKIGDEVLECYDFHVGGGLGENGGFVRKVARRIAADEVKIGIANLVRAYQETRNNGQKFKSWCDERTDEQIAQYIGVQDVKLREAAGAAV